MPKAFFTERDIEDLVKRGVMSLEINDDVVLTELAYEKATRLGLKLVRDRADKADSNPSAPMRPYLSQNQPAAAKPAAASPAPMTTGMGSLPPAALSSAAHIEGSHQTGIDLQQRIRNAVIARLGTQIDANLLDTIIKRVMNSTGVK